MLADVATQLEHPTAQTVHLLAQIAQALDSVHLLAPAKLVRSLEQACQPPGPVPERHASTTLPATDTTQHLPALRQLAHRDLLRHLDALANRQPADTAQLFDSYRALVRLSGKDSAHPADLWEQRQTMPPWPSCPLKSPTATPPWCPAMPCVPSWTRPCSPRSKPRPQGMPPPCATSAWGWRTAPTPPCAAPGSWWPVGGDAQAAALLPPDIYAKRLAARVLMLYGQQLKGASAATTPLLDELRFFCAQGVQKLQHAPIDSAPIFSAICLVYELIPALTAPQKEAAEQAPRPHGPARASPAPWARGPCAGAPTPGHPHPRAGWPAPNPCQSQRHHPSADPGARPEHGLERWARSRAGL